MTDKIMMKCNMDTGDVFEKCQARRNRFQKRWHRDSRIIPGDDALPNALFCVATSPVSIYPSSSYLPIPRLGEVDMVSETVFSNSIEPTFNFEISLRNNPTTIKINEPKVMSA